MKYLLMVVLLCAALVTFRPGALAVDAEGNYKTIGNRSCGQWVSARKEGNPAERIEHLAITGWIGGYLTAYNNHTQNVYGITGRVDLDGIYLWIDKYCRENPLRGINNAMDQLIFELWPRRIIKKPDDQ